MKMPGTRSVFPSTSPQIVSESSVQETIDIKIDNSLRAFYTHSTECRCCVDPYRAHLSGKTLCNIGHALAQEVATGLYAKARMSSKGAIQVTFPQGWESVDGLIKAITHQIQGRPSNCIEATPPARPSSASIEAPREKVRESRHSRVSEAASSGRIVYVPASPRLEHSRGSGFAQDVVHRSGTGSPPVRRSSTVYHAGSGSRSSRSYGNSYVNDPRSSFVNTPSVPSPHPSPHPSPPRQPAAQPVPPPRSSSPHVAFNPKIETRYYNP